MALKAVTTGALPTKRARHAEALPPTRDLILDAAERLFAESGVDGVALRDLAHELGLTAPSLYNHFPSKQALYDAVLDRGLRPIFDLIIEAWHPGAARSEELRLTADKLTAHLATHPHLARLLQRALLDRPGRFNALVSRWLTPLYRQGLAVSAETAAGAGWEADEVPNLALGLFGLMFAYFSYVPALKDFAAWSEDPQSAHALGVQRRFLEKALFRLLGPRPRRAGRKDRLAAVKTARA
ncbi:MAG: helix-turn-helix domain-containing protein [Candidatus Binatia bacterium]